MWYFKTMFVIMLVLGAVGLALIATDDYYTFNDFVEMYVSVIVLGAVVGVVLFMIDFLKHVIIIV